MAYVVTFTSRGKKTLLSLPKPTRLLILSWVKENLDGSDNPTSVGDRKHIEGTKMGWRWRIGQHRILARVDDTSKTVEIFRVTTRQNAYDNLPDKL